MHNDPFLYIIKYIYIFICIMLLCKEKNFIYRFGELCIHCPIQNLFIPSSYVPLVFSPLFLYSSPPKILIKSNQTFQIIERIYTAPYLLFIIIIIIHFTKENLRSKIYKTALSFSVLYPVTIYTHMKSHFVWYCHLAISSPASSATTDYT